MIPLEAAITKISSKNMNGFWGMISLGKNKKNKVSRSASNGMKRKAFGLLSIFLVIFQMFSPWMVNFSEKGISLEKNVARAADVYTPEPRIGYIKGHTSTINSKTVTQDLVFMYVDTPESTGKCYDSDINFYIYQVIDYSPDIQSYDETVDSDSDCTSKSTEWFTEKINIGSTVYRRHYFGTTISGFDRRIAIEYDLFNKNIVTNPNKTYGTDTEEILIKSNTASFGPTLPSSVLSYLDGTTDVDENAIVGSFSVSIGAKAGISPDNADIILGEFDILIRNLGEKWQDNGDKTGEPDEEDDYGAWDSIYDDKLLNGDAGVKDDITPDNDGATDRFNSYDGFILDISDSADFKGTNTLSFNLNDYVLGKDESGKYPLFNAGDITIHIVTGFPSIDNSNIANSLKENKTYYARVRVYPDNHRENYGVSMLVPEDAQIYPSDSNKHTKLVVGNKSDLTIVQNTRNGTTLTVASGQENDPTWLPECGFPVIAPSGTIAGCLIHVFYYLIFVPTAFLLGIAGTVLDFVLAYSIQPDAYKAQYIVDGWRFIRDACNLFFIFMMIYLAFKMMMGSGHGTKQAIVNTIIIATVINFSYPLTTVIIDVSNITARQLYYNAFSKTDDDGKAVSLSSAAAKGFSPQKIILEGLESNGKTAEDSNQNKGSVFMILLVGVIFNVVAMVIFIKIALQFIYRIIGLIFAIILSPLAVFSFSLSEEQRGKLKLVGFDNWMSGLLSDAFKAPVFLFLVMILILFVNNNPFSAVFGSDVNGLEWWASLIVPFMLIIAFFKIISSVTESMTSSLAQMAGKSIVDGIGKVAAFGLGAGAAMVTGGAALAGRSTIGKWAAKKAEGMRNSDGTLINDTWLNRQRLKAFDKTAKGSFDLRQTAAGNAISKSTGLNMDNKLVGMIPGMGAAATAGGYMAMQDRKRSRAIERGKLWGHNKKLEEELEHRKEELEAEVKGSESERDGVKNELKELNNGLKRYTESLDKKEKDIDKQYEGSLKTNDSDMSRSNQTLSALTAQMAAAKTQGEKDNIQLAIDKENVNKASIISARTSIESAKAAAKAAAKTQVEADTGVNKDTHKAQIKKLEDREAQLSKDITNTKLGEEKEVPDLDSHGNPKLDANGNPKMKKIRVGGISGIEQSITKVKNDRMLRATLDYKRKKTGDTTRVRTFEQYIAEKYTDNTMTADQKNTIIEQKGREQYGDSWNSLKTVAHSGFTASKDGHGHEHEVTHLVDNHFSPTSYKSNYRAPAGSAPSGGGGHDDHGHDSHGHDDHGGGGDHGHH